MIAPFVQPLGVHSLSEVAATVQLAVAPVFLLAGIGAFLNVCTGRLARIVDRARLLEPRVFKARGSEHDRLLADAHLLDRRMRVCNRAIFLAVLGAVMISILVVALFVAVLLHLDLGTLVSLLFIGAMVSTGVGFAYFLIETRLAAKAIRVSSDVLNHKGE